MSTMQFLGQLTLSAAPENLVQVTYFTHGLGHRLRMAENALVALEQAVENAFASIVNRQPGALAAPEVTLRAEADAARLLVSVGDLADRVDVQPLVRAVNDDHNAPPLVDEIEYQSAPGGRWRLVLVKNLSSHTPDRAQPSPTRELYALQTISQVMATSINLDDLLRLIVDKLVEAIDAERGTLYLIDPVRRELYSKILMEDGSKIREIRVAIGQGVAGHVAATGEVVNIQNAYADQRFIRAFDLTSGFITRSILAAPLRNPNGEIIGVVQVLNKGGGPFAERDERMLLAMAAQAAISIENARLHEQAMHQQLLNQELQTAKAIQQSFLPSRIPQHPDWEIDAYWTPARDVAGDFYDFQQLDDGRWAFVVADVSGKSIPAALFMALAATVIRFALALDFPPAELLQNTNRSLCAYNQQSQMFASIFVAYLDFATGRAECSSAGHNPPLLYRAASGQCEFIKIPGVIAGMFDDLSFNTSTIDLALDDVLVLYTDGITEAMTTRDEEFTEARLSALVAANAHRPARDILRVIIDAVAAHSGPRGAFDDETLVIIKRVHVTRE